MSDFKRKPETERFAFGGMKTNASSDSMPPGKFTWAQNIRAYTDDSIRTRPGQIQRATGAHVVTDIRAYTVLGTDDLPRILNRDANDQIRLDNIGTQGTLAGGGVSPGAVMIPFRPNQSPNPYMYIANGFDYQKVSEPVGDRGAADGTAGGYSRIALAAYRRRIHECGHGDQRLQWHSRIRYRRSSVSRPCIRVRVVVERASKRLEILSTIHGSYHWRHSIHRTGRIPSARHGAYYLGYPLFHREHGAMYRRPAESRQRSRRSGTVHLPAKSPCHPASWGDHSIQRRLGEMSRVERHRRAGQHGRDRDIHDGHAHSRRNAYQHPRHTSRRLLGYKRRSGSGAWTSDY